MTNAFKVKGEYVVNGFTTIILLILGGLAIYGLIILISSISQTFLIGLAVAVIGIIAGCTFLMICNLIGYMVSGGETDEKI